MGEVSSMSLTPRSHSMDSIELSPVLNLLWLAPFGPGLLHCCASGGGVYAANLCFRGYGVQCWGPDGQHPRRPPADGLGRGRAWQWAEPRTAG